MTARFSGDNPEPALSAACSRKRSAISPGVRPRPGYARDREKILDKGSCALLICAFEDAQNTGMIGAIQA